MKKVILMLIVAFNCFSCSDADKNKQAEISLDKDSLALDLTEDVVRHIDSLPLVEPNIDSAILSSGKILGVLRTEILKAAEKRELSDSEIKLLPTPTEQLEALFINFFTRAEVMTNDRNHQYSAGTSTNEPNQNGLAYNYSSRQYAARQKMYASNCQIRVYGLDCSGFLYHVFNRSSHMNVPAETQSQVTTLNNAISTMVRDVETKDKGELAGGDMKTGDIVYWSRINGSAQKHIGIVLKMANGRLGVFQSNGSMSYCTENTVIGRGPRYLEGDYSYFFGSNCDWKILRFEPM
jgi:hypothetical protein